MSRVALFWGPLVVGGAIALGFRFGVAPAALVAAALLTVAFGGALLWPALAFRAFRYSVRDFDLLVERGVLFQRSTSIPLDRIQHVDTRQGPMERAFGLQRLVVYTAAGLSADGSIPGLDEGAAHELRDHLSRRSAASARLTDDGV